MVKFHPMWIKPPPWELIQLLLSSATDSTCLLQVCKISLIKHVQLLASAAYIQTQ